MRTCSATAALFGVSAGMCSTSRCRLPVTGSMPASTRARSAPLGRTSMTPRVGIRRRDPCSPIPPPYVRGSQHGSRRTGPGGHVLQKDENRLVRGGLVSAPEGTRTPNLLIRSPSGFVPANTGPYPAMPVRTVQPGRGYRLVLVGTGCSRNVRAPTGHPIKITTTSAQDQILPLVHDHSSDPARHLQLCHARTHARQRCPVVTAVVPPAATDQAERPRHTATQRRNHEDHSLVPTPHRSLARSEVTCQQCALMPMCGCRNRPWQMLSGSSRSVGSRPVDAVKAWARQGDERMGRFAN